MSDGRLGADPALAALGLVLPSPTSQAADKVVYSPPGCGLAIGSTLDSIRTISGALTAHLLTSFGQPARRSPSTVTSARCG